jgi:mono/diheme cytochrome c family protein
MWEKRVSRLAFVAFAMVVTAASAVAQPADPSAAARGKDIVTKQCSRCHQVGATGASRLPAAPPFRDLMQRYAPEALEEALGEGLASGHPDMPEFTFEPEEVAAVVAYFASLRGAR